MDDRNYHQARYASALDRYITPGCRWVDLGAGTRLHGAWTGPSQKNLASRPSLLVGIDPDLDHLKRNPWLHEYAPGTIHYPAGSFDVATANMVLEHLEDPVTFFREVSRLLKPDGVFVAMTPYRYHPVVLASLLVPRRLRQRFRDTGSTVYPTFYRANSRGALWRLAARVGLGVVQITPFQSTIPVLPGVLGKLEQWTGCDTNLLVVFRRLPAPETVPVDDLYAIHRA